MNVLVTGASGLIGGRLCAYLADNGLASVLAHTRSEQSAVRIPKRPTVEIHIGALAGRLRGVDAVVHLAAPGAAESGRDLAQARLDTVDTTRDLVAQAVAAGCRRFVYMSTSKIYGPAGGNVTEWTPPQPQDNYAVVHLEAEQHVLAASDAGDIEGIVLRLANGFGAPVHPEVDCWSTIVNGMARSAAETGVIELQSPGLAMRSFVPLADICAAIWHAVSADADALKAGVFNLGAGYDVTILEMARRVAGRARAVLGREIAVSAPEGDYPPAVSFDVSRLTGTGFAARGDIDGELDMLVAACDGWFGGKDAS